MAKIPARNRATRRREAKAVAHDMLTVPPITKADRVDVTLEDIQTVFAANPMFRQAVVNVALARSLAEARAALRADSGSG